MKTKGGTSPYKSLYTFRRFQYKRRKVRIFVATYGERHCGKVHQISDRQCTACGRRLNFSYVSRVFSVDSEVIGVMFPYNAKVIEIEDSARDFIDELDAAAA